MNQSESNQPAAVPHVVVVVEGGVVQGIYASAPVRVCVKDWDEVAQREHYQPGYHDPLPAASLDELQTLIDAR